MTIDFTQTFKDLDGVTPIVDETNSEVTLMKLSVQALLAVQESNSNDSPELKLTKWELARKIFSGKQVDLTSEERSLLKAEFGKLYGPAIVGQAYAILEGKNAF